ncbi:hypothetical protein GGX14DRAFT_560764 [Mycena pura]|uniref:F-box domain-containing protein n=1 Tax=Mycena pura TaxID=153505 RepID=A0AAD6VNM1_9AGAR|nr:hypothetical protein GGX14DRAFT_560764 [Mycena pura]
MAASTSIPQPATDAATPQLLEEPDVAPIARLPPELLGDIFLLTLPTITPSTVGPHLSNPRSTSPWSLGQVCSQWRVLALSRATLWASFAVPTKTTARVLYLLTVQLERSRQAPLHVLIKCNTRWRGDRSRYEQAYTTILQTIARECHRWRMIWLELNATWPPKALFENLGKMPLLTELKLGGGVYHPFIPDVFANAPSLCRVTLSDIGRRSVHQILLPWRQITTYKATYLPGHIGHLPKLSAAAATLVECDIDIDTNHPDARRHDLTLALPRLRRLVVRREYLFGGLTTPALRELYVASSPTAHSIIELIVRSTCVLTRLTLARCAAPANEIVDLLTHTPALTTLEIQFACDTPDSGTPNALLAALAGAGLVPRLAALAWADFTDSTDRAAFADMVEARWRAARRLRYVAVYTCRLRMKASGLRLRALMREGLDVVILNARKGRTAIKRWREY